MKCYFTSSKGHQYKIVHHLPPHFSKTSVDTDIFVIKK